MTDARVVVVGGGISGLTAAHRLVTGRRRRAPVPDVLLLEAADRVGGKLRSIEVGGLALEALLGQAGVQDVRAGRNAQR